MKTSASIQNFAQQAGLIVMTAAATFGMVELPDHLNSKVVLNAAPTYAFATEQGSDQNPIRREKEEVGTHHISYGINQRTPSRSGKQ